MKCPSRQRCLCLISSGLEVTWCSRPFFIPCPRWADYPAARAPFTLELCSKGVIYWVDQKAHLGFSTEAYGTQTNSLVTPICKLLCGRSFLELATLWPWPGLLLTFSASSGTTLALAMFIVVASFQGPQMWHACSALEALHWSSLPYSFNKHLKPVVATE